MATYDYVCKNCDAPYTKVRGISEAEKEYACEVCNLVLTRIYSSIGITFNGSGFYRTENRKA